MSGLQSLSNSELAENTQELAQEERRITSALLHHLREIERRMLFAEMGFSSLLEYCVKELKYSESAAYRRISAMRLMREVPEVEAKLQSGDLSLSTLAKAQTFFKQTEKQLNERASIEEKKEVLRSLENLSSRESDRVLAERKPELVEIPPETQRHLRNERVQVTLVLEKPLQDKLAQIQDLSGQQMSLLELIEFMSDQSLRQLKKKRGLLATDQDADAFVRTLDADEASHASGAAVSRPAKAAISASRSAVFASRQEALASTRDRDAACCASVQSTRRKATPTSESNATPGLAPESMPGRARRPLSVHTQRFVWRRDQGCCQYRSPGTHKRCGSRRYLEIEHIIPVAKGGTNAPDNLQLLCRTHNRFRAVQEFGRIKMSRHLKSMN